MAVQALDNKTRHKGMVTLLSVLIVGAVGTAIAVSLLLLGVDAGKNSLTVSHSVQALALANACAETALQQIRNSSGYAGNGSLSISTGTCTYSVTNLGSQNRTITAQGNVSAAVRKISITISAITPKIIIAGWTEIP